MISTLLSRFAIIAIFMSGVSSVVSANTINLSRGDSVTLGNTTVTCEGSGLVQPVTWCSCETWDEGSSGSSWVNRYIDVFQYRLLPNGNEENNRLTYKFDFVDRFSRNADPFGPNGPLPANPERCQEKLRSLPECT